MKKRMRVVIIDDNDVVTSSVKKYFWSNAVIDVVGIYKDGKEGLNYLLENKSEYDLVILDILLPNIDGIKILSELKSKNIVKNIIVLSSYKDDYTIRQIQQYNVDYYMLKPFSIESLENRIIDLMEEKSLKRNVSFQTIDVEISNILHDLGIPSHVRGYQYIRDGVKIIYDNPSSLTYITKEVYPEIAEKYDTTSSRVERAIRHAIEISMVRGDIKFMEELFGHSIDYDRSKPTNAEFLTTLADYIKINSKVLIG